jgi:Tol biopolymer transport system component
VTTGGRGALVNLGPMVNSSGWDGQPSISADGRRLFFASDRAGGFGGTDIWYTARSSNNVWDAPVNAGPHVNTDGDELSPHVLPSGRLLFTGAVPGRGREIIAYNPNSDTSVVLDSPFNSESDELTPFVVNGVLYLASDRAGGCGGYDLYAFPALDLNR